MAECLRCGSVFRNSGNDSTGSSRSSCYSSRTMCYTCEMMLREEHKRSALTYAKKYPCPRCKVFRASGDPEGRRGENAHSPAITATANAACTRSVPSARKVQ